MSVSSSVTTSREKFDTFTQGDSVESKAYKVFEKRLTEETGIPKNAAQYLYRLYTDTNALKGQLNFSGEDITQIDMFIALMNNTFSADNPRIQRDACMQIVQSAMDALGIILKRLDDQNSQVDTEDRVRLYSSAIKLTCGTLKATSKQNSQLGMHTSISPDICKQFGDKIWPKYAAAKLLLNGIRTYQSGEKEALKKIQGGGQAIAFYGNEDTGKIIFSVLETRNSLFGFGGRVAPKCTDGPEPRWTSVSVFTKTWQNLTGQPPALVPLAAPFPEFSKLPATITRFQGVMELAQHQQQSFVDELNSAWGKWINEYKDAHPDSSPDDNDAIAQWIIDTENTKQTLTKLVTSASELALPAAAE
ncbi:MAG: hypothetical protein LBI34_03950 [Puniceicoccales bacterium]|nr:hypothetical protein [Puniceicoccales bacterium]